MGFLTGASGLPYIIALLVILIESIAALFVIFGFATRISAFGIFVLFAVILAKFHSSYGFFMNWAGTQKGEGMEYFFLLLGLALILIITGGGKASVDAAITKNNLKA